MVEAGVVALMLAFQGVAALRVGVAQFIANGAMFLFLFQALPGGRSLPMPELESAHPRSAIVTEEGFHQAMIDASALRGVLYREGTALFRRRYRFLAGVRLLDLPRQF